MQRAYWNFPRPIATTGIVLALAAEHGLAPGRCLQGTDIAPAWLEDPAATVPAEQELQVFRNLQAALGPGQGLELGQRMHPLTFGLWGFAILSSPTFGGAVDIGLRFLRLTSAYCRVRPHLTATDAVLVIDDSALPDDLRAFLLESTIGAIITMQYDLDRARVPVKALRLKGAPPPYAARWQELFGVTPEFGHAENTLAIDAQCLALQLPQGNALTQRYCTEECQRLLQRRRLRTGFAAQVRHRLARNPAQIPGMPALAAELGLHPRTLRRRLGEEGVDFAGLVDEVRGTVAAELLTATTLSLEEIASRLGYSEPSAFSRAFKRWKGMAPREFRRR